MKLHRNARTTPAARALLVQRVIHEGWTHAEVAEGSGISVRTVAKWVRRYRQGGTAALEDRSSRPGAPRHQTPAGVGCCLIGYPVAYYVARSANRSRGLLLALLVLPFWISYLMRMLAWVNLLQTDGYINRVISFLQLGAGTRNWLDGDWPTVVMGLIYGYIPFFILPLYAALERLDARLIEASRDLGASALWTFVRVTLPLSIPGLMAASVIVVLPMCGDYYTNTYLTGGSPRTEMVGNQIEFFLRGSSQPQTGASLVIVLMALLMVLMAYYLVTIARSQREDARS